MLDFWYSARCTREIKWGVCIVVCLCIYLASNIQTLAPLYSSMAIVLGLMLHVIRQYALPYFTTKPIIKIMFNIMILIILTLFIYMLPREHHLILTVQTLGFILLGLCLISHHQQREKRSSSI